MAKDAEKTELEEFLETNRPDGSEQISLMYAYCKAHFGATQEGYSKELGFSSRMLRQHIAKHREAFDKELEYQQEQANKSKGDTMGSMSRALTEEQLDKFVQVLIENATKKDSTPRQQQLLIDFVGLDSNEIMNLQAVKNRTLRWFIKNELGTIKKYLDTRQLGIMLEESSLLDLGTKETQKNTQRFVDTPISDEGFKLEALYYGMLFMSLYNQKQHPDLELIQEAVRLKRIERGTAQPINKREVRLYAKGKDIEKKERPPLTDDELEKKLSEVFTKAEAKKIVKNRGKGLEAVDTPEIDPVEIKAGVSKHHKELQVVLDTQEEISKMLLSAEG